MLFILKHSECLNSQKMLVSQNEFMNMVLIKLLWEKCIRIFLYFYKILKPVKKYIL